jgi:glucose-6-phosphate isomerase
LFGESEGKEGKGLFPASGIFSTDLHSLGQFIQEGSKILYETTMFVEKPNLDMEIGHNHDDLDRLNYLEDKTIQYVNNIAYTSVSEAHIKNGGIPNIAIKIEKMDENNFGHLVYFFEKACAMSAYLLGINPFDQPGVEIYKAKMRDILDKIK